MLVTLLCFASLLVAKAFTAGSLDLGQCQITCDRDNLPDQPQQQLSGSPGKRGPVGPRGFPGPQGPVGSCTCEDADSLREELEIVKAKLNSLIIPNVVKDCMNVPKSNGDAVADIYPFENSFKLVRAMCEMSTEPGGWTVIQRRYDGSQDFHLGWDDYVEGFGRADGEHWLGLEALHQLTKNGNYILRVELEDREGHIGNATYSTFVIGSNEENYKLTIEGYAGNIGDSLAFHNGMAFSTKDRENDIHDTVNCAVHEIGAWWYKNCDRSNLNGDYSLKESWAAVIWYTWKGKLGLKSTKMMIRNQI